MQEWISYHLQLVTGPMLIFPYRIAVGCLSLDVQSPDTNHEHPVILHLKQLKPTLYNN